MNKQEKQRLTLFKKFSQNLEWIKEHPRIKFKPDFSNGYICPLCFDVYFEKDLSQELYNPLTLEDIPPEKLGGKPRALTCKNCNNFKSGTKLDSQLLMRLLELDFHAFLPNAKTKTTFTLNGNTVNGLVKIDAKGTLVLDIKTQHSNPKQAKQFMKELILPQTIYNPFSHPNKLFEPTFQTPTFLIKKPQRSNERRAEIALLRIAYLLAYSTFGNGFYINGALDKVREQILNPEKEILPKVFGFNFPFPDNLSGMNIVKEPKELRCFLIIFNLETKSKTRQFAIALPGPSTPGIKIYENIENILCHGDGTEFINLEVEHLGNRNYLESKELAFYSNVAWQKYANH